MRHVGFASDWRTGRLKGCTRRSRTIRSHAMRRVRASLDYLAIGHWHSTAMYAAPDGALRMAYSGTHETTKFGERDSGNALIMEIAEPGAAPVITRIRTGGLAWRVIEEEVRQPGDLANLREHLEALESPAATLLELRVWGLALGAGSRRVDAH